MTHLRVQRTLNQAYHEDVLRSRAQICWQPPADILTCSQSSFRRFWQVSAAFYKKDGFE